MRSKLVHKYLAKYSATAKGRMKRPCKGIESTRARQEDRVTYSTPTIEDPELHIIPHDEARTEEDPAEIVKNVFMFC